MGYQYKRTITISATLCGTVNTSNFTFLVSGTYSWMATIANGGKIQNTVTVTQGTRSITVPADLVFSTDGAGSSLLSWEWESYNATTGAVVLWVKVPTLSASVNTVIYAVYNNSAVTTFQGGGRGAAWDAGVGYCYHFPDKSTLYLQDSTTNASDLTNNNSCPATTGEIYGSAGFTSSSSQSLSVAAAPVSAFPTTMRGWMKNTSGHPYSSDDQTLVNQIGAAYGFGMDEYVGAGVAYRRLIALQLPFTGGSAQFFNSYSFTLDTNWHLWHGVFTNTSTFLLYLDGVLLTATSTTGTPFAPTGGMTTTNIGASHNGSIDEVRIVNTSLTQSQITAEYNSESSPSTFYAVGVEMMQQASGAWFGF